MAFIRGRRLFEGGVYCKFRKNCEFLVYSKLKLTNFNTLPKKLRIKSRRINITDCFRFNVVLVMNASKKRRIDEKKVQRLFEGGV